MMVGVEHAFNAASFECDIFIVLASYIHATIVKLHMCINIIIIKPHKQKTILRKYVVYASHTNAASFE